MSSSAVESLLKSALRSLRDVAESIEEATKYPIRTEAANRLAAAHASAVIATAEIQLILATLDEEGSE